jgi:uncharacterized membrane protein YhaH (DUF805 family)
MAIRLSQLWRWDGNLTRGQYAAIGISVLCVKYAIDTFVAGTLFHRPWYPWSYFAPLGFGARAVNALPPDQQLFSLTMLFIAAPFIWLGVTLTVQRLRDAGQPLWLVVLFFIPLVNLLLFLILCVVDSHQRPIEQQAAPWPRTRSLDIYIPRTQLGAGLMSIGLTLVIGFILTVLGTTVLKQYGWGLFVALPFCLGLFSTLLYSYHEPRSLTACLTVSIVPIGLLGAVLLVVALEGIICILMAAPFALGLAGLGGTLGYAIQAGYWAHRGSAPAMLSIVLLFSPSFMSLEHFIQPQPEMFVVKSAIEVNAPPEKVWQEVVSFREIPAPTELIFRAGIAYPVRAEMIGQGAGAVRHCVFSTGAFVEPIHVWDAPRLLQFGVSENPPPMRELTPYAHIDPPHLHGYFESHKGQFLLTPLPGGRTRLEGTTWYTHTIWPAQYWRLWSDYIVHRIHMRVLEHIKAEVEKRP